jgi:hypothetical protein
LIVGVAVMAVVGVHCALFDFLGASSMRPPWLRRCARGEVCGALVERGRLLDCFLAVGCWVLLGALG